MHFSWRSPVWLGLLADLGSAGETIWVESIAPFFRLLFSYNKYCCKEHVNRMCWGRVVYDRGNPGDKLGTFFLNGCMYN